MSTDPSEWTPGAAVAQRLAAIAPEVLGQRAAALGESGPGVLASAMAEDLRVSGDTAKIWLLLTALAGRYPESDDVKSARRTLRLAQKDSALVDLLEAAWPLGAMSTQLTTPVRVVRDRVLVDVDFSAKHALNTGIQRVVRELAPLWAKRDDVVPVCWTAEGDAYRDLTDAERARALDWSGAGQRVTADDDVPRPGTPLLVPVRCVLVLAEVPGMHLAPALAALAEFSDNRVAAIGYDTIPIGSADSLLGVESEKFTQYLSVVKHTDRIAGISRAAAEEFAGFSSALPAQGLVGPTVVTVPLAVDTPTGHQVGDEGLGAVPLVLVVGTRDERKNQGTVLAAAERLHQAGIDVRLRLVGGGDSGYSRYTEKEAARLVRAGIDVEILPKAEDKLLMRLYQESRFTVFPSTHEGYGLPVAESLAFGVPALTGDYGSTAEIAEDGGAVTVDPRDDDAVFEAMRRLLTDDTLIHALRTAATGRPPRTWLDYSDDLWQQLVEPLREGAAS